MSELKDKLLPVLYIFFLALAIYLVYRAFSLGFEKWRYIGKYEPLPESGAAVEKAKPADLRLLRIPTDSLVEEGRELFTLNCASCHGASGAGDGPKSVGLNPPPRNFRQEKLKFGASPLQIYQTVSNGSPGTSMASFSFLTEKQRFAVVHFIRTLVPNPPDDPQELVDALPVVEGGQTAAPAAAAATQPDTGAAAKAEAPKDTSAEAKAAVPTPAPAKTGPVLPLDFAVSRLLAQGPARLKEARPESLNSPVFTLNCAGCHGETGAGMVRSADLLPAGALYFPTVALDEADPRIMESLDSFGAFLAQGIRGVAGHRFGNLSAAETTELYQALKSPAKK